MDSLTEEDLNRMETYLDMSRIQSRLDYEREFESAFGINLLLKEALWDKRIWAKTVSQFIGVRRSWSSEEEDFIQRYIDKSPIWITKHFPTPRSYSSVYHKRRRLLT